ncbi:hypothetical protein GCM10011390_02820 [Aureimonas endophytica]|uniref:HipA-like C-terminal domain-containing protein n=1 Tax=Aureimonas endophytica TaxID=2027858 RepID=A0A916ZBZ9_9HYPH|nr:hypothetical protein GCM10011390_02820 [Aureimonas endophytica]
MSDRSAVVWTRASGTPRRLGLLVKAGERVRFTYDPEVGDLPGITVVHDTTKTRNRTIEYVSTEANPLPPMFQSLVPPRHEQNLQRRILMHLIGRSGGRVDAGADLDWQMLVMAGRNGIGHLDVFASDEAALAYYDRPTQSFTLDEIADGPLWHLVSDATSPTADAVSIEEVVETIRSHPTVGGMMPKLLVNLRRSDGTTVDALVKIGTPDFPHVLALENLAYEIHDRIGVHRPFKRYQRTEDGVEVLATERFDRSEGRPLPLESVFTALYAASAGKIQSRWSEEGLRPSLETVATALTTPMTGMSSFPGRDCRELFRRTVMGLLTGNGDNHLENHSILGERRKAGLSPLYDPAPMRGYHRHQMVSSVSFGGVAFRQGAVPADLGEAVLRFGEACGLQGRVVRQEMARCLEATADFADLAKDVAPGPVGAALAGRLEGVRYRVERASLANVPRPAVSGAIPDGLREEPVDEMEVEGVTVETADHRRVTPSWG